VLTAFGVFQGMLAAAEHSWGTPSLEGRQVGVEGVGKVGRRLVNHLLEAGAGVVICDVDPGAIDRVVAEHPGVRVAAGRRELMGQQLDVYAPCAMGGALDDDAVATLRARIICGGANNQLAHPGIEKVLADRGILYAPDYVVNGWRDPGGRRTRRFQLRPGEGPCGQHLFHNEENLPDRGRGRRAARRRCRPAGRAQDVRSRQAAQHLAGFVMAW
jgi:hypothetical protein